jgi:putative secretion ATPase (PEP-CTERM system associated)
MYEPYYRLTGKPFQLSPDPSFYYGSPVHRRAYAYLEYGMYQGEGFIVITGEVGAGKTTLVRNLLAHLDARQVVAAHLVSTQLDADDLLRAVANAFGLPAKNADKATLLAELEGFLRRLTNERKRALLVVDEAQNLTSRAVEELRMLSNFQAGERALLQSFLIGQPELRPILQGQDMQQFRQRIIASYHLGPLDRTETESYVLHRLKQVGWVGDPRLEHDAFDGIYNFTAGIPRRINMVCNRLLLAGFSTEARPDGTTSSWWPARSRRSSGSHRATRPGPRYAARPTCRTCNRTATGRMDAPRRAGSVRPPPRCAATTATASCCSAWPGWSAPWRWSSACCGGWWRRWNRSRSRSRSCGTEVAKMLGSTERDGAAHDLPPARRPARADGCALCVVGARPNFMKMAPIVRAFARRDGLPRPVLVHTGQHYDIAMSERLFADLGLPAPDVNLEVGSGSHALQTAEVMRRFEPLLERFGARCVMVVETSTPRWRAAWWRPRGGSRWCTWRPGCAASTAMPEEINRVLTDQLAELLFTTERSAHANLAREGIDPGRVRFVGNVMIDSLLHHRAHAPAPRDVLACAGGCALDGRRRPLRGGHAAPAVQRRRAAGAGAVPAPAAGREPAAAGHLRTASAHPRQRRALRA